MRRVLKVVLGSAALAGAASLGGPLSDLNDQLAAESTADAKAADDAKCWCKEVQSVLDDRLRNSESEVSELEHIKDARFYENVGLNVEVKQGQKQIGDHSQSLQTAGALAAKAGKSHVNEKEETTQALKSLREAIKIVPKGNEVHGTLKGLEDSFSSKLEQANEEHERRASQFKDMNEAKSEMLRLAKKSTDSKLRRLADGAVVIAQAKSDITAYSAQREADWALQSTLKSVCGNIADGAAKRERQRQDTVIALSDEKAKNAQNVAMKAMSKISKVLLLKAKSTMEQARCSKVLQALGGEFQGDCEGVRDRAEDTKRRAHENLDNARKSAKDVMSLMDKSQPIQAAMSKVLSNVVMNVHLASSKGKLADGVKAKVSTLGTTADSDLKALPGLFDSVRAKAKESSMKDMKVVTSLQMGAATASKAVVDAKKCK